MGTDAFEALTALMARLAAGDQGAVFDLYSGYRGPIAACLRRHLERMGVRRVPPGELDGLIIDACLALADCAAGWDAARQVLPWTWARLRLAQLTAAWAGHFGERFNADDPEQADRITWPPKSHLGDAKADPAEWDVLDGLAGRDPDCALVRDALSRVASPRDRAIVLELRVQALGGDVSPAVTVGRRYGLTPEAVRQVASRVRSRLRQLATSDPEFGRLTGVAMVA